MLLIATTVPIFNQKYEIFNQKYEIFNHNASLTQRVDDELRATFMKKILCEKIYFGKFCLVFWIDGIHSNHSHEFPHQISKNPQFLLNGLFYNLKK